MKKRAPHHYSPFYEKGVPIFLAIAGVIVALLVVVTLLVALGIFPGMK